MSFHDFLAYGQTDSRAGILASVVQPLEHLENALRVTGRNSDSVVADREGPRIGPFLSADVHSRGNVAPVLQGVAQKVLQQLRQLRIIRHYNGQLHVGDRAAALLQGAGLVH